jgi:hypothetical protein
LGCVYGDARIRSDAEPAGGGDGLSDPDELVGDAHKRRVR